MTLEDHVGDVLRKAREGGNISLETAAKAVGLTASELSELERSGRVSKPVDFQKLGLLLDLNPRKLEGIARGWVPPAIDLSRWRELRQIHTSGASLSVNCYLVWDEVTRDAALFDTGFEIGPILDLVEEHGLELRHVFITHSHHDHITALPAIRERFPKVKLHSSSKSAPPDQRNRPNDFIHLGNLRITNRATPGHAEDGVTYIIGNFPEDAPNAAIVGDAIFAGSMGGARDCLPSARQTIRDQILSLPPPTLLCPGHGPVTTVAEEKEHNPFF